MSYKGALWQCEGSMKELSELVRTVEFGSGEDEMLDILLGLDAAIMAAVTKARIAAQRCNIERAEAVIVQARERIAELGGAT
tara:strand:+ start:2013 stop:2258 length:246 start_codon:yes stop_codon:yes gene_type:complete